MTNVVRGQRVALKRSLSGVLDLDDVQTLIRAEDNAEPYWQVTLSPVYRAGVGPVQEGMPIVATGAPVVRMTWGGGGVSYRIEFRYPVQGTSFAVAGDNIMIDVRAGDAVTVFAIENTPVVNAWIAPLGAVTALQPLILAGIGDAPFYGPFRLFPFTRAIWLYQDTLGASAVVTFAGAAGAVTNAIPAGPRPIRVPVPELASTVLVTASAGNVALGHEVVFT